MSEGAAAADITTGAGADGSGDAVIVGVVTLDTDADGPGVAYRPCASVIDAAGVSRAISPARAAAQCSEKTSPAASGSSRARCRRTDEGAAFGVMGKTSLKDRQAIVDMLAIQSLPCKFDRKIVTVTRRIRGHAGAHTKTQLARYCTSAQ